MNAVRPSSRPFEDGRASSAASVSPVHCSIPSRIMFLELNGESYRLKQALAADPETGEITPAS